MIGDDKDLKKAKEIYDGKLSQAEGGEILGDPDKPMVLQKYAELCDLKDKKFVEAIKIFLEKFKLPGEAQKIDRIMNAFAQEYVQKNPSTFPNADAAYTLAFSVIMLNTDRHNPAIANKDKMTLEGFIRNNKGMNDGEDYDQKFLEEIYHEIDRHPIPPKFDDMVKSLKAKSVAQRYQNADVKKVPIIGWLRALQNKNRDQEINELQNLIDNLHKKMNENDPEGANEALITLQKKMDQLDNKISNQRNLLGESRLLKVINDIRKEISPIVEKSLKSEQPYETSSNKPK